MFLLSACHGMSVYRWSFLLFAPALVTTACSSSGDRQQATGTLHVNAPPSEHTPEWRLSAEPVLTIGRENDSLYQFHNPGQALSLSDGRIVVSNAHQEIRYYAPSGEFLLRAGGRGRGPGEFSPLGVITVLPGDSLGAMDGNDGAFREFLVFDARGRYVRQVRTSFTGPVPLPSGGWVGQRAERRDLSCTDAPTPIRADIPLVRAERVSGAGARELARILAGVGVMMGCVAHRIPLTPQGSWAVGREYLFTAEDTAHVIQVRSVETGQVVRTIRTDAQPRRVTQTMIDEALNPSPYQGPALATEGRRSTRPPMQLPDVLPAIASMQVDKNGYLWVRRYFLPSDPEHEWWIYEPNGRLVGTLSHSTRFRVTEIGADYILGLWRDEDDVQTVHRYSLLKEQASTKARE